MPLYGRHVIKRGSMDVSYVNPFIRSTITTFKTMMGLDIKPGPPRLKKGEKPTHDVSGIIGLSGEAQGAIVLSFPKSVALKAVSKLVGSEIKIVGAEITDGIGELANIIAGYAKQELTKYNLAISLPNVVIGTNHEVSAPSGVQTIVVPFSCELGGFAMEVSLLTR